MKKLKIIGISLGGIILVAFGIQGYLMHSTPGKSLSPQEYRKDIYYSSTPTLLIPGWGGNATTYDKLIKYYQQKHIAQKVLTIWVAPNGRIWTEGSFNGQKNALIQILFTWNYNTTYHPQIKQLTSVLKYLHQHYNIDQTNVIAHSYGGTEFIHAYMSSKYLQRHLRLNKLVFLGVPVEESLSDQLKYRYHLISKSTDKNFQELFLQMKEWQLNYTVKIYNLMGSEEGDKKTDGSVPHIQSEMLKALIRTHPSVEYHQRVYPKTTHFQLHNRITIIKQIANILWKKGSNE
ncbi:alpha/beta hydrolase [Lactobacillus sp. 0.1XD8-4]|uniref:alpha/beta hydrolase n=1 Tax=uncultured Limosilactobacillus sp. TaxID=2837629 RepID=UPI00129E014F|nr:alpha/beta hydrolase [uncultured Limosilactobacillus sp.]MRN07761.1 alpha/beta hydrolase [Lactobacillus sp. 0.1XD8-4]